MDEELPPEEGGEEKEEKEERSISADLIRGHINTIILRALYDGDKYGYAIIAEIERKSHGQYSLKQPSLYSALKRLEKDGYITSYWGGSVGGGRRKYFSLTEEGKEIAETNQAEWEYSRTVIDSLISDKVFDFNNPAPSAVDMRVLRSSTSRVPGRAEEYDDLDYEPSFDDSEEQSRIFAEAEAQSKDLEAQRAAFEAEKAAYEQEKASQEAAYRTECGWREQELAERERVIEEKRKELEALKADFDGLAAERQAGEEAAFAAEEAEFADRVRQFEAEEETRRQQYAEEDAERQAAFEAEETERRAAIEAEESEKRAAFEQEEAERRAALDAEETERRAAIEAEESERRRILDEEESRRKAALDTEESSRRQALELELEALRKSAENEEAEHRRFLEEEEARRRQTADRAASELRTREEELASREALLNEERAQYTDLLHRRDEQIRSERADHAQEIAALKEKHAREKEELLRVYRQEITHRNYLDLINNGEEADDPETLPQDARPRYKAPGDYREVLDPIYLRASGEAADEKAAIGISEGPVLRDIVKDGANNRVKITAVGGAAPKSHAESWSLVHRGKALFLSAVVVFFLCLLEGVLTLVLRDRYALPHFYPFFIIGAGVTLVLVTGLAYANRYGEGSLRRKSRALLNAGVVYALCVIVTLIVALWVKIDFTSASAVATYVVVPIVFFFGIIVFGLCYYFLTRPKNN